MADRKEPPVDIPYLQTEHPAFSTAGRVVLSIAAILLVAILLAGLGNAVKVKSADGMVSFSLSGSGDAVCQVSADDSLSVTPAIRKGKAQLLVSDEHGETLYKGNITSKSDPFSIDCREGACTVVLRSDEATGNLVVSSMEIL